MARIAFLWELGGGYGHIGGFLPIALALKKRGHEVVFVLRDLAHASGLLDRHHFRYVQAPTWHAPLRSGANPINYAEILLGQGWLSANSLRGLVSAWREGIALLQPDLLVFDHSPTALLATRGSTVPRAMIGSGFFCPPRVTPLPSIHADKNYSTQQLLAGERHALTSANAVMATSSQPMLRDLADLFDVEETLLCTFSELDHYPQRNNAHYYGPCISLDEGEPFEWPDVEGARVYAYIKRGYRDFDTVLQALASLPLRTVAHIPGANRSLIERFNTKGLKIEPAPLNMRQAAAECDIAICHAGIGTVSAMLLHGKPLLVLPTHQEQHIVAQRVQQLGLGIANLSPETQTANYYKKHIKQLLGNRYVEKARLFASRYANFDLAIQTQHIVERLEYFLKSSP